MKRTRVLVVDDSLTVRRRLCEVIESDPELELIGEGSDGKQAIELCAELRPDVIALDMMLPVMTGLAATEYIMAHFPTPILIVSASTNRGELFHTYDALAAGAVDVLDKPDGREVDGLWEKKFCAALKMVARIKVITHPRARLRAAEPAPELPPPRTRLSEGPAIPPDLSIIALGASTGGPGAVVSILSGFRPQASSAVLLVIHLGEMFASAFAEWLDAQTPHSVQYAQGGELLADVRGRVLMAPPGKHMTVEDGFVRVKAGPERHSCRPSVDVLFESLAREAPLQVAACLLTGMGRDGASGLLDIKRAGGFTIAQDQASSVVYGMPREAAMLGAAQSILSLDAIAPALETFVSRRGRAT